jgi:hypothetical protein
MVPGPRARRGRQAQGYALRQLAMRDLVVSGALGARALRSRPLRDRLVRQDSEWTSHLLACRSTVCGPRIET